jgi:hypothetical protein
VRLQKNSICYILAILICLSCIGCNKTNDNNNKKKLENIKAVPISPTIRASQDTSIEKIHHQMKWRLQNHWGAEDIGTRGKIGTKSRKNNRIKIPNRECFCFSEDKVIPDFFVL